MRTCAGLCLCEHQTNSMENTGSDRSDAALETREIGVAGMTCDLCARRIENALRGVPGVKTARVDRPAARATVTFDAAKTDVAALDAAILKSGYRPTGV